MKRMICVCLALVSLVACQPEKKAPPEMIGMPNPASQYCIDQGGKLQIEKTSDGDIGYCTMPDGTRVEEWEFYRAAHPQRTE